MIKRLTVVAALVAAQGLAVVGTAGADASSIRVESGQLVFDAARGQVNRVTITGDRVSLVFTDAVPIAPGTGCRRMSTTQASCDITSVRAVIVNLGDGDDSAEVADEVPCGGITLNGDGDGDTLQGGCGADELHGGDGGDTLKGGPGSDKLYGENGTDYMDGGTGDDFLYGGDGMRDRAEYTDRTSPVTVTLAESPLAGKALLVLGNITETDKLFDIQDIRGSKHGDTLTGNSWNNEIIAAEGNDTIYGLAGADAITGADGDDKIWGGDHDDDLWGNTGVDELHGDNHVNGDDCWPGGQIGDTVESCEN